MLRFLSILPLSALFVLASSGYAQDASETRARVLASPPVLADGVITPAEPELEEPEAMVGEIMLVDDTANQVLVLLEQLTDKIILRRQDLPASKLTFNSRGSMTKREAVLALESLLSLNGIMLTNMGGRFMKAVPATNVSSQVPIMLAGSTLELDASQQIYAKLFKLDYLNAVEAGVPLVQNLVSLNSVLAFPKSNALLITDALVNLQRIETILADVDRAQVIREEIKFIKLDFVQAPEMQERIENLIQGPLNSYLEGNTSVTADERTNQLIIITHPGNLDIIMDVIESVDVDAAPLTASEVFHLRQAKAEEVVPIIEDIISGQKKSREEDAQVARENERANKANNRGSNNNNANKAPALVVNAPVPSSSFIEANSSLQFSNFVGLAADERTNSIVAYGTQQDLKTLKELIEKIDIPLPQVLIEVIITQVNLSETQTSGLSSIGFTYENATRTFSEIAASTAGGITFSNGIVDIDNASDFLLSTAIAPNNKDGNTRVLSTPRIVVSHNEEGIINVSRSQPIVTGTTTYNNSNNGNTNSTVEYRDIGIELTVTPLVGADGTVQMVVTQKVENIIEYVPIDDYAQPVIGVREATSTVSVKDGQIIVLGGLQENTGSDTNSYFPIIGRLPGIRSIFGSDSKVYNRSEIIIFIRPTVLNNPDQADNLAKDYVNLASEKDIINEYIEKRTAGDAYLEGSIFEKPEEEPETVKSSTRPRSLRR